MNLFNFVTSTNVLNSHHVHVGLLAGIRSGSINDNSFKELQYVDKVIIMIHQVITKLVNKPKIMFLSKITFFL